MGANEAVSAVPSSGRSAAPRGYLKAAGAAAAAGVLIYFFPLFHIVRGEGTGGHSSPATAPASAAFNPAAATRFWQTELPAAYGGAADLSQVARAIGRDPQKAKARFAKAAGLGTAYYFVRGRGKVISRQGNRLRIAPVGADSDVVLIGLGPVFGNTVRDGCGLLDVNSFPGLEEFNAFSAQLDSLVERTVLPALRARARVGATIDLVGCAEAPEDAPGPGQPVLTVIPVHAEVLP